MFWIILISSILWCVIGVFLAISIFNKTHDDLLNRRKDLSKSEKFLLNNMQWSNLFIILTLAILTIAWPWFVVKMGWKKYSQWYDSIMFEEKK